MNFFPSIPRFSLPVRLSRSASTLLRIALLGGLSASSVLLGVAPYFPQHSSSLQSGAIAVAQASPKVSQYAAAAFEIERLRQRNYADAKMIMGGNVPEDVCQKQDIPDSVRKICDQFLNDSAAIIQRNGLSIAEFNDITRRKASDPALQQQIQNELLRIQKSTP